MSLRLLFTGLKTLVNELAELEPALSTPGTETVTTGKDQSQPYPPKSSIVLGVRFLRSHATMTDELTRDYDDTVHLIRQTVEGKREVTIEISGTSEYAEDDALLFPILENVRTRLGIPRNRARLRVFGAAIATVDDIVDASFRAPDGSIIQAASFTMLCNMNVSYEDLSEQTIESVETEGTFDA